MPDPLNFSEAWLSAGQHEPTLSCLIACAYARYSNPDHIIYLQSLLSVFSNWCPSFRIINSIVTIKDLRNMEHTCHRTHPYFCPYLSYLFHQTITNIPWIRYV